MGDKPLYRVGVAGLDPRDVRLIEIVFRHSQYNRYAFRLVDVARGEPCDLLIANATDPVGRKASAIARERDEPVPVIAALPRGAPGSAKHAISIDRLTLQLLPILNRVVELELRGDATGAEGARPAVPAAAAAHGRSAADEPAPPPVATAMHPALTPDSTQTPAGATAAQPKAAQPLAPAASAAEAARAPGAASAASQAQAREPAPEPAHGRMQGSTQGQAQGQTQGPTQGLTHAPVPARAPAQARAHGHAHAQVGTQVGTQADTQAQGQAQAPAAVPPAAGTPPPPRSASGGGAAHPDSADTPTARANATAAKVAPPAREPAGAERPRPAPPQEAAPRSNLVPFPATSAADAQGAPRLRVLVVDDSPTVRRQLTVAFDRLGLGCETVASAAEALDRLSREHFDLALVDVVMPDADGYKLTREIKRDKRLRQMPVIILTSRSSPFDLARGALAGCDAYLSKPVPFRALEAAVVRQLRKSLAIDDLTGYMRTTTPTGPTPGAARTESRLGRFFRR